MRPQLEAVLSKAEIYEWWKKWKNLPRGYRYPSLPLMSIKLCYGISHINDILSKNRGMVLTAEFQVRMSALIKEYGDPKQTPEKQEIKTNIPDWAYVRFAQAVSKLSADESMCKGINKEVWLACRHGMVPKFRLGTMQRLWTKLTGEPCPFPER